jgi:hypothetical protein
MDTIQSQVDHSFVIGDKTLPPGEYTFRIVNNSNLSLMTVSDRDREIVAEFNVRQAIDDRRPNHSELVFRKYGNTEFLSKIFEGGSKVGVAVAATGKQEERLVRQGLQASVHGEEAK